MQLNNTDWLIVVIYFALTLFIGIWVSKKSSTSSREYFGSKKGMPWWLLGMSMVATTFSTDTPNLVTDIVRKNGVAGNWVWWAFLLTGMLTVFVYARLWKKSKVLTDIEFYELRYSGKAAAFLRGFRALYLGVFFNVLIMATVSLAAIKIGGVLLGISPLETILIAGVATAIYSTIGGFRGVILTDFLLFFLSIFGGVAAAVVALNHEAVGGLSNLLSHPEVSTKLSVLPDFNNTDLAISIFIIPIAVQWWSVWYPGAEPGGGGYIAQRMLAAKDEKNAIKSVFFFNFAHYVIRPWPWIIVALCSIVVFPTIESMTTVFPGTEGVAGHDMAYSAMLTFLPHGILGLVVVSLIAAYMSTISTHLNWGSSYVVNDFYQRFVKPDSSEKELVNIGRISTVLLMVLSGFVALLLEDALGAFQILLQIGAGTGLLFILRWFWWRINAWSEITAMGVSFLVAIYFQFIHPGEIAEWAKLLIGIGITTISWVVVSFVTTPTDIKVLARFLRKVNPGGPGWKKIDISSIDLPDQNDETQDLTDRGWNVPMGILGMVLGTSFIYSALFSAGHWIYGETAIAIILTVVCLLSGIILMKVWKKMI